MGEKLGDGVLEGASPLEYGGGESWVGLAEELEMPIAADDEGGLGEKGAIDRGEDAAIADAKDGEPGVHRNGEWGIENEELRTKKGGVLPRGYAVYGNL